MPLLSPKPPRGNVLVGFVRKPLPRTKATTGPLLLLLKAKALVFRLSGSSDLGILGGDQTEDLRPKHFILHEAPPAWNASDVRGFFHAVSWFNITVLSRRKSWTRGSPPEWVAKGSPPADTEAPWSYSDSDCCLTVTREDTRRKVPMNTVRVAAPRRKWVDTEVARPSASLTAAPTQLDDCPEPEQGERQRVAATGATVARARSRSPVRNNKPQTQSAAVTGPVLRARRAMVHSRPWGRR